MRSFYPVVLMCRTLEVSESGFHAWATRPLYARKLENARLEVEVLAAHQHTRETYGAERLHSDLADHGVRITPYRVRMLRKKLNLHCKQKRKFKITTNSNHKFPVANNIFARVFAFGAPNRAWVSDITYISTDEGWLYLTGIKDLYSGELVGYAMNERMTQSLVAQAFFRAVANKRPAKGLGVAFRSRQPVLCS